MAIPVPFPPVAGEEHLPPTASYKCTAWQTAASRRIFWLQPPDLVAAPGLQLGFMFFVPPCHGGRGRDEEDGAHLARKYVGRWASIVAIQMVSAGNNLVRLNMPLMMPKAALHPPPHCASKLTLHTMALDLVALQA